MWEGVSEQDLQQAWERSKMRLYKYNYCRWREISGDPQTSLQHSESSTVDRYISAVEQYKHILSHKMLECQSFLYMCISGTLCGHIK